VFTSSSFGTNATHDQTIRVTFSLFKKSFIKRIDYSKWLPITEHKEPNEPLQCFDTSLNGKFKIPNHKFLEPDICF
jgi:hypothetical protein